MFDTLIPPLISLIDDVGDVIMSFYKNDLEVKTKPDKTPLTIADNRSHTLLEAGLKNLTPNTPILSEESNNISFSERSKWAEYWLIDPLDGTRDFLSQSGEFCICVAYIKNNTPIFGLIYAPFGRTYYYTLDNGSAVRLKNGVKTTLKTKPEHSPLQVVVGHFSHKSSKITTHLAAKNQNYKINKLGSALKFCAIAEGKFDYYPKLGPCSEWDTAAGVIILKNAGGSVLDEQGKPLTYNTKANLSSPFFFASC